MKKKKPATLLMIAGLLTLVLCVVALAGCGGGSSESSDSSGNGGTGGDSSPGGSASIAACQANLRTIDSAIAQYKATTGKNPSSVKALVPDYLRRVPEEPFGGSYSISGGHAVCSKGHTY